VKMLRTWAVVVAAGRGYRLGGPVPKQFLSVGGHTVLGHTLRALLNHPQVEGAVITLPRGYQKVTREILARTGITKPVRLRIGGAERAESVRLGLEAVPAAVGYVMIHDGVRPCVDSALINRLLAAVGTAGAVIPGVPVTDSLKEITPKGYVRRTVDRSRIWAAQTPQVFSRSLLEEAYRRAGPAASQYTDCSGLVAQAGNRVRIVDGDRDNLKVTHPRDLKLVRDILRSRFTRAGKTREGK
jgi:2-C-methyl-D-erythritol 4-phosphate cytidylyltransferase